MSDWDEHRKENPLTCKLCGETDETVDMWCGAPWSYAHRSCAKTAAKAITLWLKRQLWIREEHNYSYSHQRGWYCDGCGKIHDFGEGKKCECGMEMRVLFTYESGDNDDD